MASELTVQTIRGPLSGANANKILIPSGQILDITTWDPPSGAVVGTAYSEYTAATTGTTITAINTINYTPKFSSDKSIIYLSAVWHHGVGPASTNLDGWGHNFDIKRNGSRLGNSLNHDVFPAAFTVSYSYAGEWYVNTTAMDAKSTSHTAGTPETFTQNVWIDGTSGVFWMINRCYAYTSARGITTFKLQEVMI